MDSEAKPKRVLLVDDHPAILQGVAKLLPPAFEVVEMLTNGTHLQAALVYSRPDILVLDITLPGSSGIELARQLTAAKSRIPIVFLTVHADPDYAREALAAGGLGYVVKPRLATDLLPALRAALAGQLFLSPCPELQEPAPLQGTFPGLPAAATTPFDHRSNRQANQTKTHSPQ